MASTKSKEKVLLKNKHFIVKKVGNKEVWEFNWERLEQDVLKATIVKKDKKKAK